MHYFHGIRNSHVLTACPDACDIHNSTNYMVVVLGIKYGIYI